MKNKEIQRKLEEKGKKEISTRIYWFSCRLKDENGKEIITKERIQKALSHKTIRRWMYILHNQDPYTEDDLKDNPNAIVGEQKPEHYHVLIQCTKPIAISTIAKWFDLPTNMINVPKDFVKGKRILINNSLETEDSFISQGSGKFVDCVEYLLHENKRSILIGKHHYTDEEAFANFDFRELLDKRKKNTNTELEIYLVKLSNGEISLDEIREQDRILYLKNIRKLTEARDDYLQHKVPPLFKLNIYITGEGGIGKDLLASAIAKSLFPNIEKSSDVYSEVNSKKVAFESYKGQPVIIWSDFRASSLIDIFGNREMLFKSFEPFSKTDECIRVNKKYGNIPLTNSVNIINGAVSYEEFLDGLAGEYNDYNGIKHLSEDKKQSYRRFPMIIHMELNDYLILLNKGFMENTTEFLQYEIYNHVRGSMKKIATICKQNQEIAEKYKNKLIEPITQKCNQIIESQTYIPTEEEIINELGKLSDYGTIMTDDDLQEELDKYEAENKIKMQQIINQNITPNEFKKIYKRYKELLLDKENSEEIIRRNNQHIKEYQKKDLTKIYSYDKKTNKEITYQQAIENSENSINNFSNFLQKAIKEIDEIEIQIPMIKRFRHKKSTIKQAVEEYEEWLKEK